MQFDWSTQPDSQVIVIGCPVTITFFFQNSALPYACIMNEDIGKFAYDTMQQRKQYEKYFHQGPLRLFF